MGVFPVNLTMPAAGHPKGIQVYAIDGDRVSESNCVHQPFTSSEVGLYKVHVLMQRLNLFWGLDWVGIPPHVWYGRDVPNADFVISCVDTRAARQTLARIVRLKTRRFPYWLDLGNNASSGQFVLGEPLRPNRKGTAMRLRCVDELYPQIVDASLDARDTLPACSASESLIRQEPYINSMLAQHALALLTRLFRHGESTYHGGFVSQETGRVTPLPIEPATWTWIQHPKKNAYFSRRLPIRDSSLAVHPVPPVFSAKKSASGTAQGYLRGHSL